MRRAVVTYGFAFAAVIAAVLLRWLLDPVMGDAMPLVTLFGAVAAAASVGGYRPAVPAAILGYLACDYLFIPPRASLSVGGLGDIVGLSAYLFTCALIIGIGHAMRVARVRGNEQAELWRVTLRSIGDAVITTDVDGNIASLNDVAATLTGWQREEAVGRPLDAVFRAINEDTRQPISNPAARAVREGVVVGLANHTLLIRKDGSEYAIDDSAAPIRNERGDVSGCVLIFRDVTAQRRAEQERASQWHTARLLASIVETSDDAIISKSLDGVIQSWNAAAERLFGYTAEEAVGRHISLVIPPERITEEDHIIARLKAGQRIDHFETERVRSDGQRILVSLTISPIKNASGQVIGASKIVRDVTDQRRAEEQARKLQAQTAAVDAKFHAFFEQGALFAAIVDLDGTYLETNRLAWEGSGYTKEQIVGRPFWEAPGWVPVPALVERAKAAFAAAAAGHIFRGEMPFLGADGSEHIVDLTIVPIRDDSGQLMFLACTGTDITDRRRAEADRQRFATIIENSTDFIGICDMNAIPFFINRAGLQKVGLDSIEQARRTSVREFFFPEDQSRIIEEFFPAVLEHGHGEIEVRFRHFKTGEAVWMAYKVLTLTDAAGQPVALATVSQDITERKRLEEDLRRLAADLSEADRRKNEFLAMLAHELRNPLAPISNAVQVLRRGPGDAAAVRSASEMLGRQVGQMGRLVDDLLDMSRITRGKIELRTERIELGEVVQQAVDAARALYTSMHHELTISVPPEPVHLVADPARLTQIVGNLLNNAGKFTERGGHIWLTVERDSDQVVIRVRDNGIGIAAAQLPRIFEMFMQLDTSLERERGGLGIGLTLVKTLVEMHAGTVEARSDGPGRGSEFIVRLPVFIETAQPVARAKVEAPAPTARRRVLIVDDNQDGAESLAMLLEIAGHETRTANDGLEAIEATERFRPDAVLLDIGLPKLNGYEVCRRIRQQPWGQRVLMVAVTGWGQEEDRHRSLEAGFDTHIVKPVDHDVLMRVLARLTEERPPDSPPRVDRSTDSQ